MTITLCNLKISSEDEEIVDLFLKTVPFSEKIKNNNNFYYMNIAINLNEITNAIVPDLTSWKRTHLSKSCTIKNKSTIATLYLFFNKLNISNFSITSISTEYQENKIALFYSDGSSDIKHRVATYAMATLLRKSKKTDQNALLENYSGNYYTYKLVSEKIPNGTNNSGELSGIIAALDAPIKNKVKIIISDSEYSVKCFREWIYNWRLHNYCNSTGKQISNYVLIREGEKIIKKNSINLILLKWTKGHANDNFNNLCDEEAHGALDRYLRSVKT